MSEQRPTAGTTSALLGDLESIRSLLEEAEAAQRPPEVSEDEVPLLEDVVQGGVSVNESFLAGEAFDTSDTVPGLDEAIFKALLSDEWRDTARAMVADAPTAEAPRRPGAHQRVEELDAEILTRIDATLQRWLRQAVLNGIDDLRRELLAAVRSRLDETSSAPGISAPVNETSADENLDGA